MNEQNLYNTPNASLNTQREEFYQPKLFSWSGRLGRLRYFTYILIADLIMFAGLFLAVMAGNSPSLQAVFGFVAVIMYIAVVIYSLSLMKRRLNDFDASGWWMLIMLIPIANGILGLLLLFMPGTKSSNKYGPMPAPNKTGAMLALIFGSIVVIGVLAAIAIPQYQSYMQRVQQMNSPMDSPMDGQLMEQNQ